MLELSDQSLRRRLYIAAAMAVILPAVFGGLLMSLVGYYSLKDIYRAAFSYAGLYVFGAGVLAAVLVGRVSDWLIDLSRRSPRQSGERLRKALRPMPAYLLAGLSVYSILGLLVLEGSLLALGLQVPLRPAERASHLLAATLPILAAAVPLFFMVNTTLDRYFAPRGIVVVATPLRVKLLVSSVILPLLVDVMLLAYFTNRDGVLDRKALWIWLGLLAATVVNFLMASMDLSRILRPLQGLIASPHVLARARAVLVPLSLDEVGMITGRLRAWLSEEEALRRDLDVATERLVQATSAADLGIFDHDLQTDHLYWSAGLRRIVGMPDDEQLDPGSLAQCVHPEDRARFALAVERCRDPASDGRLRLEYRIIRRDGQVRWLTCYARTTFVEEEGRRQAVRITGTLRDNTERAENLARRQALENDLQEARRLEAVGTFAGGIAHDFNNLLMVISGNLQQVRKAVSSDQGLAGPLHLIDLAAQRGRDLVEQLSVYARGQRQTLKPVAARLAITEGVELVRANAPDKLSLELDVDTDADVMSGGGQLQQVTFNLVKNAVQAVEARGGSVRVAVRTIEVRRDSRIAPGSCRPGNWVRLVVADTGVGMSPATMRKVFEPFFTTRRAGNGTGLGLAVVDSIVRSLGGAIRVDSVEGSGSTFEVWLPVAERQPAREGIAAGSATMPGRSLLYVDDDPLCGELLARELGKRGWTVTVETSPVAGLALLRARARAFDLVLSDYKMPGMSGMELSEALRTINPSMPVVIVTGEVTDTLRQQAKAAGALAIVGKSAMLDSVAQEIEDTIRGAASAAEPAP